MNLPVTQKMYTILSLDMPETLKRNVQNDYGAQECDARDDAASFLRRAQKSYKVIINSVEEIFLQWCLSQSASTLQCVPCEAL